MRVRYKDDYSDAVFETKSDAVDFMWECRGNDRIVAWSYKVRKIKAGWVVYRGV